MHFPTTLNNELKQNKGHIFQLNERAKNFNECFLGIKLEVEILYELGLPCYLTVRFLKDGNLVKIEEYSKIVYIDSFGVKRYSDKTILKIINKDGISKNIGQFFDVDRNI